VEQRPRAGRDRSEENAVSTRAQTRAGIDVPVQVFEPYRHSLPPLKPYAADLWRRRTFASHMARATLRGRNYGTVLGQLWLVVNPFLLALVYYLLITVLEGRSLVLDARGLQRFAGLLAGLFAFYYTRNVIQLSATSITGGGKMIMNIAFPKMLLPLSCLCSSALMYFPMLLVYAAFHVIAGRPVSGAMLWLVPIFLIQTIFSFGASLLFAAMAVYFRDVASFLPYGLRIWLYISPVIYDMHQLEKALGSAIWLFYANPLVPILGAWDDVLRAGQVPSAILLLQGLAWALGTFGVGAWFFMSREREFAVRI
jgi:teichoic acid transport system permease protein